MAANVEKSPLIRFVDKLDFKQIPVSVKRKKKEECPSGLILIDSNCELTRIESSSENSSGEEDELEGENNSDRAGPNIQLLFGKSRNFKKRRGTRERKAECYNFCEEKFQKAKSFKEYLLWRRSRRTM